MCGIVGLHLKTGAREAELGSLIVPMLNCMSSRGSDSAGMAIFSDPVPVGRLRYSVTLDQADAGDLTRSAAQGLADALCAELGQEVQCERIRPNGVVLVAPDDQARVVAHVLRLRPDAVVTGTGRSMEIVKDTGGPAEICRRNAIGTRQGFQAIGHTRMATESAVTPDHSHPFAPTPDLAVVHNGSFSNPATVRRRLSEQGIECVTDNDTEVAARLIGRELSYGSGIHGALKEVANEMDGFYTLLVATDTEIAVVRDSFACKPMVVAETDEYVAFASEYIAMTSLPNIESAHVFEPKPEEIHLWQR